MVIVLYWLNSTRLNQGFTDLIYFLSGSQIMNVNFHLDNILLIIGLLLALSVVGFLSGQLVYPFGSFILLVFFIARVIHLRSKKQSKSR